MGSLWPATLSRRRTRLSEVVASAGPATPAILALATLTLVATPALAAPGAVRPDGAGLGRAWGLPSAGMLLSIALFPLAAPHVWERHFGKVAAFWAGAFVLPLVLRFGPAAAATQLWQTAALE